jgi:hypothetical protein
MSLNSQASNCPDAIGVPTARRGHHLRMGLSAVVVSSAIGVFGAPTLAQASTISPKAFCDKIPVSTVSSLFGQTITLLGALAPTPGNDVCEFAKIVNGSVSGVTLNYDYKGTGTTSSNIKGSALSSSRATRRSAAPRTHSPTFSLTPRSTPRSTSPGWSPTTARTTTGSS